MSPTTLYREGTDLDDLLAELDSRYPGQVRVVEVTHPREGGVLGFFAKQRIGVHYRLTDEGAAAAPDVEGDAVLDPRSRRPVPERVAAAALGGDPGPAHGYDAAPAAGSAGAVRAAMLRDGFGPDPAVIRAALAHRGAEAPAAEAARRGVAAAASGDVGTPVPRGAVASPSRSMAANAERAEARPAPADPFARGAAGSVLEASRTAEPGLQFAQLLADIALKKASGGPAVRGAARPAAVADAPPTRPARPAVADEPAATTVRREPTTDRATAQRAAILAAASAAAASLAATRPPTGAAAATPTGDDAIPAAASGFATLDFAALDLTTLDSGVLRSASAATPGTPAGSASPVATTGAAATAPGAAPSTAPPHSTLAAHPAQPAITLRRRDRNAEPIAGQPTATPRPGALSWPLAAARPTGGTALLEQPAPAVSYEQIAHAFTPPQALTPTEASSTPPPVPTPASPAVDPAAGGNASANTAARGDASAGTAAGSTTATAPSTRMAPAQATGDDVTASHADHATSGSVTSSNATSSSVNVSTGGATSGSVTAGSATSGGGSVTAGAVTSSNATSAGHTTPLALRRQLLEIGVPVDRVPTTAVHSYAAIEQLVRGLAPAPALPTRAGRILVLAGPAHDVVTAADSVLAGNPGVFESVWTFGCPAGLGSRRLAGAARALASAEQAADAARAARSGAEGPTLVIVAADTASADGAADVISALDADSVWAAVDATRKPADTRRVLRALPDPDAIAVTNAELSASPATVWELDLPIALLDGRPSSGPSWAVLLLGKLAELEETECSDAPC